MIGTAVAVEWLKLRRSPVIWIASAVLVLMAPLLSAAFMAASGAAGGALNDSLLAAKVDALLVGTGWTAYLGLVAQVLSVASLLVVGFAVAWSVGREFADRTIGSLLALPVRPGTTAAAKLIVVLAWALTGCAAAVVVALAAGPLIGLGPPDSAALAGAVRILVVGMLGSVLAIPIAVVATIGRGHLPAIATLIGIVVVTQIVTTVGVGGWFPYAAPSLWTGMGGPDAAEAISAVQLLTALPVAAAGAWATVVAWRDLQLT